MLPTTEVGGPAGQDHQQHRSTVPEHPLLPGRQGHGGIAGLPTQDRHPQDGVQAPVRSPQAQAPRKQEQQ